MSLEREPTYQDWIRAVPAERRNLFSASFERGRRRMEDAWNEKSNVHGRVTCPCMGCAGSRTAPRAERMWQDQGS